MGRTYCHAQRLLKLLGHRPGLDRILQHKLISPHPVRIAGGAVTSQLKEQPIMTKNLRFPAALGSRLASSSATDQRPIRKSHIPAPSDTPKAAPQIPPVAGSSFNLELALSDLRASWLSLREGHRTNIRRQITDIFSVASHLRDNLDDRVLFARQPEWNRYKGKKPNVDKPDEMLLHVIRFAFGFHAGAKSRVTRYAGALTPAFQAGIPWDKISEHVRANGGISKMYDATKQRRVPRSPPPIVTIKLVESDLAKRLLELEPGQEASLRIVINSAGARVASAELVKLKPRKLRPKT